jgi:hypothetical protein
MMKPLNLSVPEQQKSRLEEICSITGFTKSELVRQALEDFLRKWWQEHPEYQKLGTDERGRQ